MLKTIGAESVNRSVRRRYLYEDGSKGSVDYRRWRFWRRIGFGYSFFACAPTEIPSTALPFCWDSRFFNGLCDFPNHQRRTGVNQRRDYVSSGQLKRDMDRRSVSVLSETDVRSTADEHIHYGTSIQQLTLASAGGLVLPTDKTTGMETSSGEFPVGSDQRLGHRKLRYLFLGDHAMNPTPNMRSSE